MIVKESTNHYHDSKQHPDKNRPVNINPKSKTQTVFQSLLTAGPLNRVLAVIVMLYSITDCSVGYKYINIFGIA